MAPSAFARNDRDCTAQAKPSGTEQNPANPVLPGPKRMATLRHTGLSENDSTLGRKADFLLLNKQQNARGSSP
jgi:hypothetical protein